MCFADCVTPCVVSIMSLVHSTDRQAACTTSTSTLTSRTSPCPVSSLSGLLSSLVDPCAPARDRPTHAGAPFDYLSQTPVTHQPIIHIPVTGYHCAPFSNAHVMGPSPSAQARALRMSSLTACPVRASRGASQPRVGPLLAEPAVAHQVGQPPCHAHLSQQAPPPPWCAWSHDSSV